MVSKAWQLAYDQAIVRQGADMGGSVRTGVNAVVNALQALAGGDIRAALAQGAAPYLAAKVKELTTGNAPYSELTDTQKLNNLMAHALLGGVVAELSGGSAAAGATGAVTGELATPAIALALYGTADSDKLSPDQKANLSALATLASGIAAGVSSGSTAGAATGALAGKNAVENNSLSGDKSRESVKQIAGNMKDQVRDKLGEGTLSAIVNSIIGAAADTGDAVLGGADYGADAAMALTSCAMGDSYCTKAISDLSGKNKAAADTLKALMKSETWEAVAGQVKEAAQGNQLALEATGGMLAGLFLPGKKLPDGIAGKAESIAADIGKTGTVFDSIKGTQPVYPGSVIPKSFEMTLPNGQKVWVHGNATEHMAEYAASKAVTNAPEAVGLASQTELRSFQAALDTATKNGMSYGRITVDGWQLEIKPPRSAGELPTVIHARYLGAN
nr:VENN motif pre-toxin domain-containing protein [Pantoea ananatis]